MTVQFQLTEQEVIRGMVQVRGHLSWHRLLRLWLASLATGTVIVLVSLRPPHTGAPRWFSYVAVFVIATLTVLAFRWRVRRRLSDFVRHNATLYISPQLMSFDENGLSFTTPTIKQELAWSAFNHRQEANDLVYLFADPKGLLAVLPKRAFGTDSWQEFLRCSQSLQPV